MDAKRVAMVIGIAVLLPLFLGLFVDAVYQEPQIGSYCNDSMYGYSIPAKPVNPAVNCTYVQDINQTKCYNDGGQPRFVQDNNGCEVYDKCDYCSRDFNDAQQSYNRNIFFILMPIGLVIVIIGIYLTVEYIGAALMFAGLITMFYATIRYFSNMSKILRALVILVELLIIMWIGYKKIGEKDSKDAKVTVNKKRR